MTIDYSKFDSIEDSDDEKPEEKPTAAAAKPAAEEKPHCHNCHKDITKPLKCGRCQKVVYCSAQCQKEDWPYHKRGCQKKEEPKPKETAEQAEQKKAEMKAKDAAKKANTKRREEEEKITEDDADLKWYRHREWKPEEKKEFTPTVVAAAAAAPDAEQKKQDGSEWNQAGTWEDKDVTELALSGLQKHLRGLANIDAAGGNLTAEDVEKVEGEASKPVIRGKRRHMFDLSFKVKFGFKWMDASGQRNIQGSIEVADFTNDTFTEGVDAEPAVQLSFRESRQLDAGRSQAVLDKLGAASWPPPAGSLMADVSEKMQAWVHEYMQMG